MEINYKGHYIISSIIIALAFIICALIFSSTLKDIKNLNQTIAVTGAAFKPIASDFAVWEGAITTSDINLETASVKLKNYREQVIKFFIKKGFNEKDFTIGPVNLNKNYDRDRVFNGYSLRQNFKIELDDVERITNLAKDVSELIENGVEVESWQPQYLFTRLNEVKLEMIQEATENAKLRAEQLAKTTGKKVGSPQSARVGVFQIRPSHSQEVSDYGINDVRSINKEIACTVHISFLIE